MNKIKFIFKSMIDGFKYFCYKFIYSVEKTPVLDTWVISERGNDARDNGYWFYRYMIENHPEIEVKYIISKDSADRSKIKEQDIIEYRSKDHYYYFLNSKYLISAEIMGFSPNEQLFYRLNKYGLLRIKGKTVFLQHGITKDFNPYMLPQNAKLDLFICGAKPEYKYMIEKYGYKKENVALTGFARFDKLEDKKEKMILIMPTWRKWLKYNDTLINTEFYNNYNNLINDKEIISKLEEKGYKIVFYPHTVLQKFLKEFNSQNERIILADFKEYDVQDLLKKCELLVTDYSSVAFDTAYMKKKTIYFQFDLEQYRKEQYQDGYYSYEENGFGPVCNDYEKIKGTLLSYLDYNKVLDKYNNRINDFFENIDQKNCERIYKVLIKK